MNWHEKLRVQLSRPRFHTKANLWVQWDNISSVEFLFYKHKTKSTFSNVAGFKCVYLLNWYLAYFSDYKSHSFQHLVLQLMLTQHASWGDGTSFVAVRCGRQLKTFVKCSCHDYYYCFSSISFFTFCWQLVNIFGALPSLSLSCCIRHEKKKDLLFRAPKGAITNQYSTFGHW